jgi:hypothetical protein
MRFHHDVRWNMGCTCFLWGGMIELLENVTQLGKVPFDVPLWPVPAQDERTALKDLQTLPTSPEVLISDYLRKVARPLCKIFVPSIPGPRSCKSESSEQGSFFE